MKVEIVRLNDTGDGIGKINGKIVFVKKTLPGDIVTVKNIVDKKKYLLADKDQYLTRSPLSIEAECPFYEECGGCQIMTLPYQEQLNYKKNKVIDIFKKYPSIEINPEIIGSPEVFHYRNKITLQVEKGKIGFYHVKTNQLVPIQYCPLAKKKTNEVIDLIETKVSLDNVHQIVIKEFQEKVMVQVKGKINEKEWISILKDKVDSLYLYNQLIYGKAKLEEILDKYHYFISPDSFFQVNHEQTIRLYQQVKEYLGSPQKNVLDLYCGMASIGIFVSDVSNEITGIELNSSSIKDAKENILSNHLSNVKVKEGDVGKLLDTKNTYDAIIVDPPRSGLDKKTKSGLLKIKSKKIIYVSCNPMTLARDIDDLKEEYELEDIMLFDLFPNTYHVESIVLLKHCKPL